MREIIVFSLTGSKAEFTSLAPLNSECTEAREYFREGMNYALDISATNVVDAFIARFDDFDDEEEPLAIHHFLVELLTQGKIAQADALQRSYKKYDLQTAFQAALQDLMLNSSSRSNLTV